jgi:hypothetical protein
VCQYAPQVGSPEILAEQRLGHDVPWMRGLYAHASPQMREELLAALQARWGNVAEGTRRSWSLYLALHLWAILGSNQ